MDDLEEARRRAAFWQEDSGAAWDNCEKRRLQAVELARALEEGKYLLVLSVSGRPIRNVGEFFERVDILLAELAESNK